MSEGVPGWLREAILYYGEWNYKSNQRIAREKWRIDRNQNNSIYAHYNSVATELMHSFKDGLSSIGTHAPFEDDLRFLSRIKHLIDEKIDSPECKLIAGELIETRELFLEDFKESFEAINEQGISDIQGQSALHEPDKYSSSKPSDEQEASDTQGQSVLHEPDKYSSSKPSDEQETSDIQGQSKKSKPVKPETKKRYERMQKRVDEIAKRQIYLSHRDICTRIAREFRCAADTIRKNTNLIRD